MSEICYIFAPIFLLHCFNQVLQSWRCFRNFSQNTITQMSFMKCNDKITNENCGTQTKRIFLTAYEEVVNWDTSFYSVSRLLNNFPDIHLFTSSVFSNDRWNFNALFVDNSQVLLINEPLLKAGIYSLASNKLQSTLQ